LSDASHTGACSSASYAPYIYYCPRSSASNNGDYDGGLLDGLSGGERTCAVAVFGQAFASAFSGTFNEQQDFALSDATCKTCGDARYCPVGRNTYTDLNPQLFNCQGGGRTDNGVTWCAVTPSGGFIALVVILPLFGILGCVLGCCFCCPNCPGYKRTHRATAQPVMVAMNPLVMAAPQQVVYVQHPNAGLQKSEPREAPAAAADAAV
jgi:hypothetical protein